MTCNLRHPMGLRHPVVLSIRIRIHTILYDVLHQCPRPCICIVCWYVASGKLSNRCCSVLQCAAVCCSALQCVAVRCSALQCVAVRCFVLQYVAVCCSVLQCVAVCCSVLQCVVADAIYMSFDFIVPCFSSCGHSAISTLTHVHMYVCIHILTRTATHCNALQHTLHVEEYLPDPLTLCVCSLCICCNTL